jgi:hypothetical protein
MKIIHRRDAEFTEKISEFEFPTLRPRRLRSESFVVFVSFVVRIYDGE